MEAKRGTYRGLLPEVLSPAPHILASSFWTTIGTYWLPSLSCSSSWFLPSRSTPSHQQNLLNELLFSFFPLRLFLRDEAQCLPLGSQGLSQHLSADIYFIPVQWLVGSVSPTEKWGSWRLRPHPPHFGVWGAPVPSRFECVFTKLNSTSDLPPYCLSAQFSQEWSWARDLTGFLTGQVHWPYTEAQKGDRWCNQITITTGFPPSYLNSPKFPWPQHYFWSL